MKTRTESLANEMGLNFVEITQGMNGYPSGLYKAIAGFDSFEDAESFADEVNGEVVLLTKRDGHQFWVNSGRMWGDLELTAEDYGDDCECVTDFEDWWEDKRELLADEIKGCDGPDDLTFLTDSVWKIYNAINNLKENEQVLLCRGEYYDTIPIKTTRYHIDVYERIIAVVDHETDEDETNEDEEDKVMKKIMILAFYAVSNSMDYERYSFDYDNSDLDTYKKLLSLNDEDVRIYSVDTSVQRHLDLNDFVEDYNDEYLDGGWWCIKLHLTKEEIESCY